jgi:hypothetical protein
LGCDRRRDCVHRADVLVADAGPQHPHLRRRRSPRNGAQLSPDAEGRQPARAVQLRIALPSIRPDDRRVVGVCRRRQPRHPDHRREPRVRLAAHARLLSDGAPAVRPQGGDVGGHLRARLGPADRTASRLHDRRSRGRGRGGLDLADPRLRRLQPGRSLRRCRARGRNWSGHQGAVPVLRHRDRADGAAAWRLAKQTRPAEVRRRRADRWSPVVFGPPFTILHLRAGLHGEPDCRTRRYPGNCLNRELHVVLLEHPEYPAAVPAVHAAAGRDGLDDRDARLSPPWCAWRERRKRSARERWRRRELICRE